MKNNSPWNKFSGIFCPKIIWYIIVVYSDVYKKYYGKNLVKIVQACEKLQLIWNTQKD